MYTRLNRRLSALSVVASIALQGCSSQEVASPVNSDAPIPTAPAITPKNLAQQIWDPTTSSGQRFESALLWSRVSLPGWEPTIAEAFEHCNSKDSHKVDMLYVALRPPKSPKGKNLFLNSLDSIQSKDEADEMALSFWASSDKVFRANVLSRVKTRQGPVRDMMLSSIKRFSHR